MKGGLEALYDVNAELLLMMTSVLDPSPKGQHPNKSYRLGLRRSALYMHATWTAVVFRFVCLHTA
jgi:hypothetical protein